MATKMNDSFSLTMSSLIFRTVARGTVPIVTLFSIHLLLRGHQEPGGGFIAGLMTAAAVVLVYLAFGYQAISPLRQRISYYLLGVGLAIAFGTGLFGLLLGDFFLKSGFRHVYMFFTGSSWEFASAAVFDFGVYLVVVGVTLAIMNLLGTEEGKTAAPAPHESPVGTHEKEEINS